MNVKTPLRHCRDRLLGPGGFMPLAPTGDEWAWAVLVLMQPAARAAGRKAGSSECVPQGGHRGQGAGARAPWSHTHLPHFCGALQKGHVPWSQEQSSQRCRVISVLQAKPPCTWDTPLYPASSVGRAGIGFLGRLPHGRLAVPPSHVVQWPQASRSREVAASGGFLSYSFTLLGG